MRENAGNSKSSMQLLGTTIPQLSSDENTRLVREIIVLNFPVTNKALRAELLRTWAQGRASGRSRGTKGMWAGESIVTLVIMLLSSSVATCYCNLSGGVITRREVGGGVLGATEVGCLYHLTG